MTVPCDEEGRVTQEFFV